MILETIDTKLHYIKADGITMCGYVANPRTVVVTENPKEISCVRCQKAYDFLRVDEFNFLSRIDAIKRRSKKYRKPTKTLFGKDWIIKTKNLPVVDCTAQGPQCKGKFLPSREGQTKCIKCIYHK